MKSVIIKNLSKSYGSIRALQGVSFEVEQGSIFGLIGPNGAGKSTLVKSILGLIRPDAGEITLNGLPHTSASSRRGVSYLPEVFQFYPYYTVEATLTFFARLHGESQSDRQELVESALRVMHLEEIRNQKIRGLSKGQLQRTGLASLFTGNVQTIILDEPFYGLDPIGVKELKDLLVRFRDEGRTVFINSHLLSEVQNLCDSVALIHRGSILKEGSMGELTAEGSLEDFFYKLIKSESGGGASS